MGFTLLPALDVAHGRAVRLVRGDAATETGHGDPRCAAQAWQDEGAEWIHLVDLDAAFERGSNAPLLAALIDELDVPVQLSGGIRDDDSLDRALGTGCARVNLATSALHDPAWCARVIATHGERLAVSLDVHVVEGSGGGAQHRLVARGGAAVVGDLWEVLAELDQAGCARYVVTDVDRDGTLGGPNLALYRAITSATRAAVVTSGGVASIDDLVALAAIAGEGPDLDGAIVGQALHTGRFGLPEALAAVRQVDGTERATG